MVAGVLRLGRVVVVALVAACSHPGSAPNHTGSTASPAASATVAQLALVPPVKPAATSWAEVVPLPALVAPELADVYADYAREVDPRSWFFAQPQRAPSGFVGLRAHATKFPGGKYAKVRAYRYGGDALYPLSPRLDPYTPGCGVGIVASDGTLCPSVQYPGWDVTAERAEQLFAILNTKNDVPRVVMNGYHFDRGFVVYDANDVPVAQVLINAHVDKLRMTPSLGKPANAVDYLSRARSQELRALLQQLGLGEQDPQRSQLLLRQAEADGELHPARYIPFSSGVDGVVPLADTTAPQRSALCAWQQQAWARGAPRSGPDTSGIECEDGWRVTGANYAQCVAEFPSCDATVAEVEACMREQRFFPCLEEAEQQRCRALRSCFWGIRALPQTSP